MGGIELTLTPLTEMGSSGQKPVRMWLYNTSACDIFVCFSFLLHIQCIFYDIPLTPQASKICKNIAKVNLRTAIQTLPLQMNKSDYQTKRRDILMFRLMFLIKNHLPLVVNILDRRGIYRPIAPFNHKALSAWERSKVSQARSLTSSTCPLPSTIIASDITNTFICYHFTNELVLTSQMYFSPRDRMPSSAIRCYKYLRWHRKYLYLLWRSSLATRLPSLSLTQRPGLSRGKRFFSPTSIHVYYLVLRLIFFIYI